MKVRSKAYGMKNAIKTEQCTTCLTYSCNCCVIKTVIKAENHVILRIWIEQRVIERISVLVLSNKNYQLILSIKDNNYWVCAMCNLNIKLISFLWHKTQSCICMWILISYYNASVRGMNEWDCTPVNQITTSYSETSQFYHLGGQWKVIAPKRWSTCKEKLCKWINVQWINDSEGVNLKFYHVAIYNELLYRHNVKILTLVTWLCHDYLTLLTHYIKQS